MSTKKLILTMSLTLVTSIIFFGGCSSFDKKINKTSSDLFVFIDADTNKIPKNFKTYLLFLQPSYKPLYNQAQWDQMYQAFKELGVSIGKDNAAVWLAQAHDVSPNIEESRCLIDKINKSSNFLETKLEYDKSPIIIFSNYNPDTAIRPDGGYYTAIQFEGNDPRAIINFFDKLSQSIRSEKVNPWTLEKEQWKKNVQGLISKILGQV